MVSHKITRRWRPLVVCRLAPVRWKFSFWSRLVEFCSTIPHHCSRDGIKSFFLIRLKEWISFKKTFNPKINSSFSQTDSEMILPAKLYNTKVPFPKREWSRADAISGHASLFFPSSFIKQFLWKAVGVRKHLSESFWVTAAFKIRVTQ